MLLGEEKKKKACTTKKYVQGFSSGYRCRCTDAVSGKVGLFKINEHESSTLASTV